MNESLSRLPWHARIAACVLVSAGALAGFWQFHVSEIRADIQLRKTRLSGLRADIDRGSGAARRLREFRGQVADLERQMESLRTVLPEQKDVGEILRRVQELATQSNLTIQRFTPQPPKQQPLYQELPFRIVAEGGYHDLGTFFDRVRTFPRIITLADVAIRTGPNAETGGPTIVAECTATTFVMREAPADTPGPAAPSTAPAR